MFLVAEDVRNFQTDQLIRFGDPGIFAALLQFIQVTLTDIHVFYDTMRAMLRKVSVYLLVIASCLLLLAAGFSLGLTSVRNPGQANDATSTQPDLSLFWEAWDLVNDRYLNAKDVSDEEKVRGSVAGLVYSLNDPYSEYFAPEEADDFKDEVDGSFGGIGAQLDSKDGNLVVVSPLKGSPAQAPR